MKAQVRENFGKGAARSLRRAGQTPAILYGLQAEPTPLQLNTKEITLALIKAQRRNALISLDVDDNGSMVEKSVIVKDLQTDPVKDYLVHLDFLEVATEVPMEFQVPLKFTGKALGVEMGGDMHEHMFTVTVMGLIADIPDFLEFDVTEMKLGEKVTCAELPIPENIELVTSKDDVCVSIAYERVAVEEVSDEDEAEVSVAIEETEDAAA